MKAPCFNCEKRSVTCHSTCERYKEYKNAVLAESEQRKVENALWRYRVDMKRKFAEERKK